MDVFKEALKKTFDPDFELISLSLKYWPEYKWMPLSRINQEGGD